jgi:heat shock protein HtpX
VVNAFSRAREYRADEGGAKYTSKAKMISGLKKLQSMSQLIEKPTDTALAAMQIASAEGNEIFSTHPHIAKRIAALEANYMLP